MNAVDWIIATSRIASFALAGLGMGVVLMSTVLTMLMIRDRAARSAGSSAMVLTILNLFLVCVCSVLFWLAVMFTFKLSGEAGTTERSVWALMFAISTVMLRMLYVRATPERVEVIRRRVSRVAKQL
jgi:hypothetical protein